MREYLDIVDENGVPTGETVERGKAHAEGIMHRTAHVWLVRYKNGRIEILLQKRSADKDSFPDCYDISSAGHIPAGVDFRPSAIRELKEELGVDADESELIYCGDRHIHTDAEFHGRPFHDRQFSRVFALVRDIDEDGFTLQKEEVSKVLWMGLDELIKAVEDNSIKHCVCPIEPPMVKKAVEKLF